MTMNARRRAQDSPVTIEEVAAKAGVSRSTVSRVINGSKSVSPATAESVGRAITELDYVPNEAARSLAARQARQSGFTIPSNCDDQLPEAILLPSIQSQPVAFAGSAAVNPPAIVEGCGSSDYFVVIADVDEEAALERAHEFRELGYRAISAPLQIAYSETGGPFGDGGSPTSAVVFYAIRRDQPPQRVPD